MTVSTDAATRRRSTRRARRPAAPHRGFPQTMKALDGLVAAGAQVSVHVRDLDSGAVVLAGDDHVVHPVAGVGAVPVLLEVASAFLDGRLDARAMSRRVDAHPAVTGGLWQRLGDVPLSLGDLAVLGAAVCDPAATNILLGKVGLGAVDSLLASLGLREVAVLDAHRDVRGPDDAPYTAVGSTRELARLMALIANGRAVTAAASAQTGEWLTLNADLTLVGAGTGLDPFDHDNDRHGLLFFNKTGRADGVRADAGVLAGPRAGIAYALTVCFDDLTVTHRLRVVEAMRQFGIELMEYVH